MRGRGGGGERREVWCVSEWCGIPCLCDLIGCGSGRCIRGRGSACTAGYMYAPAENEHKMGSYVPSRISHTPHTYPRHHPIGRPRHLNA